MIAWTAFRCLAVLLPLVALVAAGGRVARADFEIAKVDSSVVRIQHIVTRGGRRGFGPHGTGFVINRDGYVITNQHVVAPPRMPAGIRHEGIYVPDGSWAPNKLLPVTVVWQSRGLDLAIVRVRGLKRPPVIISATRHGESPKKGEKVYAVGFPGAADASPKGALSSTLTSGIVGKVFVGRGGRDQTDRPIIQHEAGISPGNSGGPLFNECNQVIGVNTFVATSRFIVRREGGRYIARGAAVSGVYYSSHVNLLVAALRERNIAFRSTSSVCAPNAPGQPSSMMVVYVIAALGLAAAAVVLAIRRPRERVVKVVETYSQRLRRKGPLAAGPGPALPLDPEGTTPGHRAMPAAPAGPAQRARPGGAGREAGVGWAISGFDSEGHAVRLAVGQNELALASRGLVIGRQESLSDLILEDTSVSRRHARVVKLNGGVGIVDLNSSNGTAVDGRLLQPYSEPMPLSSGATIEFGDVKLTFNWS